MNKRNNTNEENSNVNKRNSDVNKRAVCGRGSI
jgi:hypothetical protein